MKKYIVLLLFVAVLVTGCGQDAPVEGESSEGTSSEDRGDGSDNFEPVSDSEDMNDDDENRDYIMIGQVKSIDDKIILMDADVCGLVYVSFPEAVDPSISPRSIVEVAYSGEIMESWPCQANGYKVISVTPYEGQVFYTFDGLENTIREKSGISEVVWSDFGDYVAYSQKDMSLMDMENYFVYVASPFEEEEVLVDYIEGSQPFISWMLGDLQVGTASSISMHTPPFEAVENPSSDLDTTVAYNLNLQTYNDDVNDVMIHYYVMSDYTGELIQDYMNQSLYEVVDIFKDMATGISIEAEILRQDEILTVSYSGMIEEMNRPIEKQVSLHVPTATVLTVDNIIGDIEGFKFLFEVKAGTPYDELEGVSVFFLEETIVFTYVPLDDMADRVYVPMTFDEMESILDFQFELPAS